MCAGGATFSLENEVILQCQQRQLAYSVIKVGCLLDRDTPFPANERLRPARPVALSTRGGDSGKQTATTTRGVIITPNTTAWGVTSTTTTTTTPFVFTRSRVEPSEVTQADVAVEALLRAASHPHTNSSVSVVSIDQVTAAAADGIATDQEWDDEFLRLDGPELLRIPLRFCSALQMSIKVGRVARDLQSGASGKGSEAAGYRLVTPIEVVK